jgi:catechol 2,3-dioxygenase-like lactoylglutathione lyase family enzyme
MRFTGVNHVCVATRDLDRAVRIWSDRYGVGPWALWTKDSSNFAMRVALCSLPSGTRIELIEPLDDRSPYAESLARHGGADHVHHVRLDVDDFADTRETLTGLGLEPVLDATFAGAPGIDSVVTATYLGTEDDLGFLLEIGDVPTGFAMPEPELVYP